MELFSNYAERVSPSPIRDLKSALKGKQLIRLDSADPSPAAIPFEDIERMLSNIAGNLPEEKLFAGSTRGRDDLIEIAVKLMADKGVSTNSDDTILVNGSQRALDLIGRAFINEDDVILVEQYSYSGALAVFSNMGADIVAVEMDSDGISVDDLGRKVDAVKSRGRTIKFLYTVPTYHNPTGTVLADDRKPAIIDIAEKEGFLIVEDDPYGDIWFENTASRPHKPLKAAGSDKIIYISSFSKIIAPGLRTAYMTAQSEIIEKVEQIAQASDLAPNGLVQSLILEIVNSGLLAESMKSARDIYRKQHAIMNKSLDEFMPEGVVWNNAKGGFFIWMEIPDNIPALELLNAAVSREVSFIPGKLFTRGEGDISHLRLSYSFEDQKKIRVGVASLATAIRFWDMKKKIPWALGDCC